MNIITTLTPRSRLPIGRISERGYARQCGEDLGRKLSFTREQFVKVRAMLRQQTLGIAQIAKETGLTRQTVYRIKADPAGAEAALAAWGM